MFDGKKRMFLKCAALLCAVVMLIMPMEARADALNGIGGNAESQNYTRWASPVKSYLSVPGDGTLMRVEACDGGTVLVEYYDVSYQKVRDLIVPAELPLFGGFYEMDGCYYIVSGQVNPQQSADVEVYRVTKYDRSWNRLGSAGLYDCNTVTPFDAGSLRFARCGQYLLVRTCHEMYRSSDGLNHQANVTFEVDTQAMKITDSVAEVSNTKMGYVSHSFNQFIRMDGNNIVAVDHGDAYPRSIVLTKYKTDASSGQFTPNYWDNPCETIELLKFPGAVGDNTTGASVGGFEIMSGGYVTVGNSVVQDGSAGLRSTRNIFVATLPKGSSSPNIKWITNYAESDGTTSTPQLVKISEDRAVLLWSRSGVVYYTVIDGSGNVVDTVYSVAGSLSDCAPILVGNKVVWYAWTKAGLAFYDIPLNL